MKEKWSDSEYKKDISNRMKIAWQDPEKRKRRSDATKERWSNLEFKEFAMGRVRDSCSKPIRCVETGEYFKSMTEAAVKYNCNKSTLTQACKEGYRCRGFHWEYA